MVEIKNCKIREDGTPVTMYTILNTKGHYVSVVDEGPSVIDTDLPSLKEYEDLNRQMKVSQKVVATSLEKDRVTFETQTGEKKITVGLDDQDRFWVEKND